MSTQQLPIAAVQKIQRYIQSSLTLPESEEHPEIRTISGSGEDLPEPDSLDALGDLFKFSAPEETTHAPNAQGEWFISVVNPGYLIDKLPGLSLGANLRMVTYLYRKGSDGSGITWAIPEAMSTTDNLEKALDRPIADDDVPRPDAALDHFMQAVEGDRSPTSFVVASILRRELQEFGAAGTLRNWSRHRLIGSMPAQLTWVWHCPQPKNLAPKVRLLPDDKAAVEFFSCRVTRSALTLFRHVDLYPSNSYYASLTNQAIAAAQPVKS